MLTGLPVSALDCFFMLSRAWPGLYPVAGVSRHTENVGTFFNEVLYETHINQNDKPERNVRTHLLLRFARTILPPALP